MRTEKYGRYYFCIKTNLSKDGEIYATADQVEIKKDGTLVLWRMRPYFIFRKHHINISLAPGNWKCIYAASFIDGSAIAVEIWSGEVSRS